MGIDTRTHTLNVLVYASVSHRRAYTHCLYLLCLCKRFLFHFLSSEVHVLTAQPRMRERNGCTPSRNYSPKVHVHSTSIMSYVRVR